MTDLLAGAERQINGLLALAGQARQDAAKAEALPQLVPEPVATIKHELAQSADEAMQLNVIPTLTDYSTKLQAISRFELGLTRGSERLS